MFGASGIGCRNCATLTKESQRELCLALSILPFATVEQEIHTFNVVTVVSYLLFYPIDPFRILSLASCCYYNVHVLSDRLWLGEQGLDAELLMTK